MDSVDFPADIHSLSPKASRIFAQRLVGKIAIQIAEIRDSSHQLTLNPKPQLVFWCKWRKL